MKKVFIYIASLLICISAFADPVPALQGVSRECSVVAVSPSGDYIATSDFRNIVHIYRGDGLYIRSIDAGIQVVRGFCFSPDDSQILIGGSNSMFFTDHPRYIGIWDIAGNLLSEVVGESSECLDVQYNESGNIIAAEVINWSNDNIAKIEILSANDLSIQKSFPGKFAEWREEFLSHT